MSGAGRGKKTPTFDLSSPYNSQSLAAGGSALLDAINRGKVHLAKFILDAGEYDASNVRDFKGKTPLIRACYIREMSTRDKAVKLLIRKGANVNVQDDCGRTALSYACEMRCNDIVRILLKNNVDPDIADKAGNTPLIYSVKAGNDTAVEIILRSFRRLGLNVDHVNNEGMTALLIAAKNGYIACASLLATEGKACLTFRDREEDRNAEEWARAHGCSTPEVIPFSANAQLYQNKLAKYLQLAAKQFEFEDEEEEGEEEVDESDDDNDDEACGESPKEKQQKQGHKRTDLQQPNNRPGIVINASKEDLAEFRRHQAMGGKKRGSLPAIKLTYENNSLAFRSESFMKKSPSSVASTAVSEVHQEQHNENGSTVILPPLDKAGQVVRSLESVRVPKNHQDHRGYNKQDTDAGPGSLSPVTELKTLKVDNDEEVNSKTDDVRVSSPPDGGKNQPLPPIETGASFVVLPERHTSVTTTSPRDSKVSFRSDQSLLTTSKVDLNMESGVVVDVDSVPQEAQMTLL